MMFIDNVALTLSSGKGGPGCVSFRREKHVIQGGPDGGDGGKGGNVYFQVDVRIQNLTKSSCRIIIEWMILVSKRV